MPMPDAYRAISLLDFNVGAAAAVAFLNPLSAQLDALIALGLGPFQASLAAQFNAALAMQASLTLSISLGDLSLLATLKSTLAAVATLQAALAAALTLGLPPIQLSLGAELGAAVALAGVLKLQLGGIQALIKAAIAIKLPAVRAAASLGAALSAGPFFAISFSGVTLASVASWLAGEVAGGGLNADGQHLLPGDVTFGALIFGTNPSFQASFNAIIAVPP